MTSARAILTSSFLAFAACDSGVVIEVRTSASAPADTVELFLVADPIPEPGVVEAVQPPAMGAPITGAVYHRDQPARFIADVGADGIAVFQIEPGDVTGRVARMIAVGTTDGAPTSAALVTAPIKASGTRQYLVDLEAADGALELEPSDASTAPHVKVWLAEATGSACLAFERGSLVNFIVPPDDSDCDGVTDDHEQQVCTYIAGQTDAGTATPPEVATCIGAVDDLAGTCALGLPNRCDPRDSNSAPPACHGGELCVPSAFCSPSNRCVGATTPTELDRCLAAGVLALPQSVLAVPGITCAVPMRLDGAGMDALFEVCAETHTLTVTSFSGGCADALLANVAATGLGGFSREIDIGQIGQPATRMMRVKASRSSNSTTECAFDLDISGTLPPSSTSLGLIEPAVIVMRPNTPGATHSIALPVRFTSHVTTECAVVNFECHFDYPEDKVFTCVQ